MTNKITPPTAEKRPSETTTHGITRRDDYAWLRADNWQEVMRDPSALDADIRQYLDLENDYQEHLMAPTSKLQETLFAEMRGRIKEDDSSVPTPDGPYAYGSRYVTGGQHPLVIRCARDGGDELVLIDGDKEAQGKSYFQLGGASHSPDHSMIAWAYDDKGSEYFTLRIRDANTGIDRDTRISDTAGGGEFCANNEFLFYIRQDENHRPSKLFRHEIGTDPAADVLVYEESDPGFLCQWGENSIGDLIVISIHDHETSEMWFMPATDPTAKPTLVAKRQTSIEYSIDNNGDTLYILTNADNAEDFKVVTASVSNPSPEHLERSHRAQDGLSNPCVTVYKNHMVRLEREDGLPRIVIHQLANNDEHAIEFDEQAYSLGISDGYEFDTDQLRFTYSSMTTPSRVMDYNVSTRQRTLLKEQEVPSGHKPGDYVTRRLQATAPDGELVPISIVHHKGHTD